MRYVPLSDQKLSKTDQNRSKTQFHYNFITILICKLRRNASECRLTQLEMFLYYLEHVSKPLYGQYSMENLDVTDFQDLAPTLGNVVSPPFKGAVPGVTSGKKSQNFCPDISS